MAKSNRRVRFFEVCNEEGQRMAPIDWEKHFFEVVDALPAAANQHWDNGQGLRVRGRLYRQTPGTKPRQDLVILDRVHREPAFSYVQAGSYSDHEFDDPEKEFAEPKFLAFFERNLVATFTTGLRAAAVEAALNSWRAGAGLAPVRLVPVVDTDRLRRLSEADSLEKLRVTLPAEVARAIYRSRGTSLANFFRSRSKREGRVTVDLRIDISDHESSDELLDELKYLMSDEAYSEVASDDASEVEATYLTDGSNARHSHNFLGQTLAITVVVDVEEPERGPQPHHASEALVNAFTKRRERLFEAVPE